MHVRPLLQTLLVLLLSFSSLQAQKINFFKGSWDELQAEAQKTNKPYFVDFYATWCGPCKLMDKKTFVDPQVVAYVNAHYLAYKLDVDRSPGDKLSDQFGVEYLPTFVLFSPQGQVLAQETGYHKPDEFIALLQTHQPTGAVAQPSLVEMASSEPTAFLPNCPPLPNDLPLQATQAADHCLNAAEWELVKLLNDARKKKGLPAITVSRSLSYVARLHAHDLHTHPRLGNCNMHTWSDNGPWKPCCYTPDHKNGACMWDKPRELTPYPADGFELSHFYGDGVTPKSAQSGWLGSNGHRVVLLNEGDWKKMNWQALGVGIVGNYAVAWFGTANDPAGVGQPCD
jgi:thioredoxin-related protein